MRVVNNEKERVKSYLRSDVESNITNMLHASNEVQAVVAQLSQIMSGSLSSADQALVGKAQQSLQYLSQALQHLHQAQNCASQLDTTEEIPDEQY